MKSFCSNIKQNSTPENSKNENSWVFPNIRFGLSHFSEDVAKLFNWFC